MPKVMEDRIFAQIFEGDVPASLSAEDEIKRNYNDALIEAQWDFHYSIRGMHGIDLVRAKDDFNRKLAEIHREYSLELLRLQQRKDAPVTNTNIIEAPPPARLGSIHDGLDMGTGRRAHNAPKADE